ncbi:TetR/AcrR family transcriptional regulator [Streptomyces halobius]|uniref:TetR/AcrR family transcriptional regulator n=1 Tax=Streptomyces halobius TaxID=2879846 RepID=A0ABY4MAQ0_9ACTN|nr:TetR/AcrR family transcriptional regulator [Streptomyces halobius]UQA94770.1 TetR/AcrR family transcriptional regulator [Streptomyces halobius]
MAVQQRRERQRAQRHQLIVKAARELAETEGWGAVTTRRLAERIEYSQPVLYSHFASKGAIVNAVALEGFAELAVAARAARKAAAAGGHTEALLAVARAYAEFASANPALYDAMFTLATDLDFGSVESPEPLKAAFDELLAVFGPLAGPDGDPEAFTEVGWSALHGLVTLDRAGRLREGRQEQRITLLVSRLAAATPPGT